MKGAAFNSNLIAERERFECSLSGFRGKYNSVSCSLRDLQGLRRAIQNFEWSCAAEVDGCQWGTDQYSLADLSLQFQRRRLAHLQMEIQSLLPLPDFHGVYQGGGEVQGCCCE